MEQPQSEPQPPFLHSDLELAVPFHSGSARVLRAPAQVLELPELELETPEAPETPEALETALALVSEDAPESAP